MSLVLDKMGTLHPCFTVHDFGGPLYEFGDLQHNGELMHIFSSSKYLYVDAWILIDTS